jgi:hypothetical protein
MGEQAQAFEASVHSGLKGATRHDPLIREDKDNKENKEI